MMEKEGLVKLVEECGELIQIASKKMVRMDTDTHWDGAGSLKERLTEEIADVIAACRFVMGTLNLDDDEILVRTLKKVRLFRYWHGGGTEIAIPVE